MESPYGSRPARYTNCSPCSLFLGLCTLHPLVPPLYPALAFHSEQPMENIQEKVTCSPGLGSSMAAVFLKLPRQGPFLIHSLALTPDLSPAVSQRGSRAEWRLPWLLPQVHALAGRTAIGRCDQRLPRTAAEVGISKWLLESQSHARIPGHSGNTLLPACHQGGVPAALSSPSLISPQGRSPAEHLPADEPPPAL